MKKSQEKWKLLRLLLCLCLVLPCMAMTVLAADGDPCGTEGCEATYTNGFCSEDHYEEAAQNSDGVYEIGNAGQLYWFAKLVDSGTTSASAILTDDIEDNKAVLEDGELNSDEDIVGEFRSWNPIGSNSKKYVGTFDGNGHTISGLYYEKDSGNWIGLVASLGEGGVVKNVKLTDSYIYAKKNTGAIVGTNVGGTIENCTSAATVITEGSNVGGITGHNNGGKIIGCTNTGSVTGENEDVGGIAGRNEDNSTIERCLNSGPVNGDNSSESHVGGITGYNYNGDILDCYNTGDITGKGTYIGGVAGAAYDSTIVNCYNIGQVTGKSNVGGILGGHFSAPVIQNCYYLSNSDTDSYSGTQPASEDRLASGEIAYRLNGSTDTPAEGESLVWYQTLGTDPSPVFQGSTVSYGYDSCAADAAFGYTNDGPAFSEKPGHTYEQQIPSDQLAQSAGCVDAAQYYAKCDVCGEPSDTVTVFVGEPNGHSYEAEFEWNEAEVSAVAVLTCTVCDEDTEGHVVEMDAAVEQTGSASGTCQSNSTADYTATVELDGKEYSESKTIEGGKGSHEDQDQDHLCDVCEEPISECEDTDKDHSCNICGGEVSKCEDTDKDHNCDICGGEVSKCEDTDKDHNCDTCGEELTQCADGDGDYKCDLCGEALGTPPDPECPKDATCILAKYSDVVTDAWYHDGVHYCVAEGLMNGMSETTFEPDTDTSRAMLVTMLYRMENKPDISGLTEPFEDVKEGDWFYEAIVWAYNEGVVKGTSDTTFEPDTNVSREQVATIMHRYNGTPEGTGDLSAFPDAASVGDYAAEAMVWAVGEGLINGVKDGEISLLAPTGSATRAQIATILYRYLTAE